MELDKGLRLRKPALNTPIETKRTIGGEGEVMVEGQPLSPKASLFHAPGLNCWIIFMMGTKTKINVDAIKAGVKDHAHPRMSCLMVVDDENHGKMRWIKTKINIDNHVFAPDLDPNMASPDKFVEDYTISLTKTPVDLSKPLWELHLLNIKTSNAKAIMIFKIHHSFGDGASLMSFVNAGMQNSSDPKSSHIVPMKKDVCTSRKSDRHWSFIFAIRSNLQMIWNTIMGVSLSTATMLFLKDSNTPLRGPQGVEFTPKRFVHHIISLDDVMLVKNALDVTVNDVLLGVTEAGLSRYLNRRYGKDEKDDEAKEKENNLPGNIYLRATIYVSLRPTKEIQGSADKMEEPKIITGNKVGYVLFPFTIALRDDPLDYVHKAKATSDRKKLSLEASYSLSSVALTLKSFGFKAAAALYYKILSNTTMTYSSLIGSLDECDYFGHPLTYMAFGTYGYPRTLSINFMSYVKNLSILLVVDQDVVPDPHRLCDDLQQSLKAMKNAVIEKGLLKIPHKL